MNDINSSDLLNIIQEQSDVSGRNIDIDIQQLAQSLNVWLPKLIAILTELEQRDKIVLEISTISDAAGVLSYKGNVRLMEKPPDESKSE